MKENIKCPKCGKAMIIRGIHRKVLGGAVIETSYGGYRTSLNEEENKNRIWEIAFCKNKKCNYKIKTL